STSRRPATSWSRGPTWRPTSSRGTVTTAFATTPSSTVTAPPTRRLAATWPGASPRSPCASSRRSRQPSRPAALLRPAQVLMSAAPATFEGRVHEHRSRCPRRSDTARRRPTHGRRHTSTRGCVARTPVRGRADAAPPRLRTGAPTRLGWLLELRHLVHHHLHPGRLSHVLLPPDPPGGRARPS